MNKPDPQRRDPTHRGAPTNQRGRPLGERFTMAELVKRTGVPPATVRHYLRLGLLPPADEVAPNRFLYDRRHEQRVKLVRLLRERRQLPLAAIRRILPRLAGMPEPEAFRPEMWDELVETQLRARNRAAPAARLLRAGMAAFTRHGFAEVKVDDVCQAAKVAKGSFYRHFRSKEDLYFAAAVAAGAQVGEAFSMGGVDGVSALSEEEAGAALGEALAPHLPLLLDLLALAAQRRPHHAQVAREIFADLRGVVTERLEPAAGADTGQRVLGAALLAGLRDLIAGPAQAPALPVAR